MIKNDTKLLIMSRKKLANFVHELMLTILSLTSDEWAIFEL